MGLYSSDTCLYSIGIGNSPYYFTLENSSAIYNRLCHGNQMVRVVTLLIVAICALFIIAPFFIKPEIVKSERRGGNQKYGYKLQTPAIHIEPSLFHIDEFEF